MTKERLEELKKICEDARSGPDADTLYNAIEKLYEVSITAIPELIAAYEKAVWMLKRLEEFFECGCPICFGEKGHAPDCELKKILMGE